MCARTKGAKTLYGKSKPRTTRVKEKEKEGKGEGEREGGKDRQTDRGKMKLGNIKQCDPRLLCSSPLHNKPQRDRGFQGTAALSAAHGARREGEFMSSCLLSPIDPGPLHGEPTHLYFSSQSGRSTPCGWTADQERERRYQSQESEITLEVYL